MSEIIVPNATECQAILRSIDAKCAKSTRADMPEGRHLVQGLRVEINGVLDVGSDYTQRIHTVAPWERVAVAAMIKLSPDQRSEVLALVGSTSDLESEKQAIASELEPLRSETVRHCRGKVSAKLIVSKLNT